MRRFREQLDANKADTGFNDIFTIAYYHHGLQLIFRYLFK